MAKAEHRHEMSAAKLTRSESEKPNCQNNLYPFLIKHRSCFFSLIANVFSPTDKMVSPLGHSQTLPGFLASAKWGEKKLSAIPLNVLSTVRFAKSCREKCFNSKTALGRDTDEEKKKKHF